jgi:hypothetical protein
LLLDDLLGFNACAACRRKAIEVTIGNNALPRIVIDCQLLGAWVFDGGLDGDCRCGRIEVGERLSIGLTRPV